MADNSRGANVATRVVVRPLATPLPLGFLALSVSTMTFSSVQLEWVDASEGRVAALTALMATLPLQLLASVMGFLARDPVAATGMGLLAGTWAVVGAVTWTSEPGQSSDGLGVLLLTAGAGMLIPAIAALGSKVVAAAVMTFAAVRFAVTGIYEITDGVNWQKVAGWTGVALAAVALYAAAALELEAVGMSGLLPVGRRDAGRTPTAGPASLDPTELGGEPGVRPLL